MTARTTPALVQSICARAALIQLPAYIDTANNVVTNICGSAGYSEDTLELIERWLAAHYFDRDNPQKTMVKIGEAEDQYGTVKRRGYAASPYGETAMNIDWQGLLARQDAMNQKGANRKAVGILYLGSNRRQHPRLTGPKPFPPPYPGPPTQLDL